MDFMFIVRENRDAKDSYVSGYTFDMLVPSEKRVMPLAIGANDMVSYQGIDAFLKQNFGVEADFTRMVDSINDEASSLRIKVYSIPAGGKVFIIDQPRVIAWVEKPPSGPSEFA